MIKLIDLLKESISGGTVYTYRSRKSLPDIKANGIKMSDQNKQNSEDYNIPSYEYTYFTSTSKNSNWIDNNPYGDMDTPYTVRVAIDLNKIKNDENYSFKELDSSDHPEWNYPEYQEVRIYSNTKNRIPPEYITSIDILRRRSGDEYGWDFNGILDLEPEVKKYIDDIFKNNPNLDADSFSYDEMYDYFTKFWKHETESYDDTSQEVIDYIESKT
jgi:hypothetical protein